MLGTAVLCGSVGPESVRRHWLPRHTWTCVGALALPLWATWPTLALRALTLPTFECLTIAFAFGWMVLTRLERPSTEDAAARASLAS